MNNMQRIFKTLKKPTVILFGIVIFFFSSLITIVEGGGILEQKVFAPMRYKSVLYDKLANLAPETNVNYFISQLGEAAFINEYKSGLKEYIFVHKLFYVQAIVNKSGKVIGYSVTTRDKNFNPRFSFFDIYLGESTFQDIAKEFGGSRKPDWLISYLGAHDLFYTEGYYMGNPGGYQSFFFGMSMADYSNEKQYSVIPDYQTKDLSLNFGSLGEEDLPQDIQTFLAENVNTINTYSILSPFVSIEDIASIRDGDIYFYLFGPDQNQVRLLDYAARPTLSDFLRMKD
jgi:hypothetical protein